MTRRSMFSIVVLTLALGLVSGSTAVVAADDLPAESGDVDDRAGVISGASDFTMHGTAWVPQRRARFKRWLPRGWGIEARAKVATDQWVHIPVPIPSYIDDEAMRIKLVEFCAQSSNGAATKPTRMDLWANDKRFASVPISWPATNQYHCFTHTLSPPVWQPTLGVSVLLHFDNATDQITLYKAWAQVLP